MTRRPLLLCAALLLAAAAPARSPVATASGATPVRLAPMPGSALEATAKRVAAADVEDGGTGALLLLGSQHLGTAGIGPALFVQVQSPRSCGSAGCSTSIYLPTKAGWTKVMDGVSGNVAIEAAQHGGMHDLLVGRDDRWAWNGTTYVDTLGAPQVDLRPRQPRPAHPAHPVHRATRTRSQATP